jgi:hypothetical protein
MSDICLDLVGDSGRDEKAKEKCRLGQRGWFFWLCPTLAFSLLLAACGSNTSDSYAKIDASLVATSRSVMAPLSETRTSYETAPAFPLAFRIYVSIARGFLDGPAQRMSRPGQFEQVVIINPRSMPPESDFLSPSNQSLAVMVPVSAVNSAISHGQSSFLTIKQNGRAYRSYVTPLRIPALFHPRGVAGALEVFQKD